MKPLEDLFNDNMEKYADAEYYDLEYESNMKDLPLLLEWAHKKGGKIVDLACGTGRITIPLAEHGFQLLGVDLNKGMLTRAKEKSKHKNLSIEWVLQDCTSLLLKKKSSFIYMTGNSFQHFLTNDSQNKLLQSIYSHLEYDGVFIFNTRFPIIKELSIVEETTQVYIDKRNRKLSEHTAEVYNPLTQILFCKSTREILNNNNETILVENDSISLRYVFPLEMERLLEGNKFKIIDVYGSWDKNPLNEDSTEMIYVCKK